MDDSHKTKAQLITELTHLRQRVVTLKAKETSAEASDTIAQKQRALQTSEARLRRAEIVAQIGNWEFDLKTNMVYASEGARRIYGLGQTAWTIKQVQTIPLPDYRPLLDAALKDLIYEGRPYDVVFKIQRPTDGLVRDIHSVAEYDAQRNVVFGIIQDVTERKRAEVALRESEERYRQLVELSPDLIAIHSGGKFIYINQAGMDLLGVSNPDQVIGQPVTRFVIPARREIAKVRMHRLLAKGQRSPIYEQQTQRLDGTKRDIEVVGIPFTYRGDLAVQIIAHDITDRKATETRLTQALEERTALVQELYHRTRNNMQVIRAMLRIYAEHIADARVAEVFKEMEDRIYAMALVHHKLYQSQNLSRINLREYIRELFIYLMDSYRVPTDRVTLIEDMEETSVLIDTAAPCGLVLNELFSNIFKHAFPNDREGKVRIRLHRVADGETELIVADNGIGVPDGFDFGACKTMGIQNVITIVEYQLQGKVTFETNDGVTCRVRFRDDLYEERV
jgi:PAS domain S-box-containing protein